MYQCRHDQKPLNTQTSCQIICSAQNQSLYTNYFPAILFLLAKTKNNFQKTRQVLLVAVIHK